MEAEKSIEVRIKELYLNFEKGDDQMALNRAPSGVMIVGESNIGKTALFHLMAKHPMVVAEKEDQIVIDIDEKLSDETIKAAKIGHQSKSTTKIPNHCTMTTENGELLHLYDCPGFNDSNGFEQLISNCYYVYSTFLSIPKNKFVLVIRESALDTGKASGFITSVKLFLGLFEVGSGNVTGSESTKQPGKISVDDIARHTVLVITKARTPVHVQKTLQKLTRVATANEGNMVGQFVKHFTTEDRIDIVGEAEQDQPLPTCNVVEKLSRLDYFNRAVQNGGVNMDVIKHTLADGEIEKTELEMVKVAFLKCATDIEEATTSLCKAIAEITLHHSHVGYSYQFIEEWSKTIEKIASDPTRENKDLVKPSKYPHFNKLRLLQEIIPLAVGSEDISTPAMQKLIGKIVRMIGDMLDMSDSQFAVVRKFSYLIDRKYEEAKILSQIRDYPLPNRKINNDLKGCFDVPFETLEERFVLQFEITSREAPDFYEEAIRLFDKHKTNNPQLLEKISLCKREIGNHMNRENSVVNALNTYVDAWETSEECNKEANKDHYVKVDIPLARDIANLCFKVNEYEYALLFFKVINDTAMVKECYKNLIRTQPENAYKLHMQHGEYLVHVALFDKAMTQFKYAGDSTDNLADKKKSFQRMHDVRTQIDALWTAFENRINRDEFFIKLPAEFDKKTMYDIIKSREDTFSKLEELGSSDLMIRPTAL